MTEQVETQKVENEELTPQEEAKKKSVAIPLSIIAAGVVIFVGAVLYAIYGG